VPGPMEGAQGGRTVTVRTYRGASLIRKRTGGGGGGAWSETWVLPLTTTSSWPRGRIAPIREYTPSSRMSLYPRYLRELVDYTTSMITD